MLITKLNPQNPDFAESEGSGGGAKKQTEFVLSKQPTFRAGDARKSSLLSRYAPYNSCHGGKTLPYSRKRFRRFLFLRQVFPFSQKVTQAELFAMRSLSLAFLRHRLFYQKRLSDFFHEFVQ